MASETIKLDPSAEAVARTEFDITKYIGPQGPDWGDAAIEAYKAQTDRGEIPVDFRLPNRVVRLPLLIRGGAGGSSDTFEQARAKFQAKAALFQREGGWISRQTSVGTLYADVLNATLKLGSDNHAAAGLVDRDAELVLECSPDFYGPEETTSVQNETSLPELIFTLTGIKGNYPGRGRLVVTDTQGVDQLGLIGAFRSRYYDSASTARLAYEAEALTPMDTAATAAQTGASGAGSNVIQHTNLGSNWTPVMNTNLLAGTYLTHVGTYRVRARVRSTTGPSVKLRFVWDVGDMTNPAENDAWEFPNAYPDATNFYMADLGEVRLDKIPSGTHRWQGQIQAKGSGGGESVQIDRLEFIPLDECAFEVTAPLGTIDGLTTYTARDEFNQAAGNLSGKTLPAGGTWSGAGDTDDFAIETSGKTAQRTAVSDANYLSGRYALAGTTAFTDCVVQVDFKTSAIISAATEQALGVIARYTDTSNFVRAYVGQLQSAATVVGEIKVGGTSTFFVADAFSFAAATWYTMRLYVDAAGRIAVWTFPTGSAPGDPIAKAQIASLATGGALASGKAGIYDAWEGATALTRNYDNFFATVPAKDAAVFANRIAELRHDSMNRQDSAGNAYGPITRVSGDLVRVPPAGIEGRTLEVFLKSSRGDFDQIPDFAIDDQRAQLFYRPCWTTVPAA